MPKRKMAVYLHPDGWSANEHYGMCGQSCPCCRYEVESQTSPDPASWLGACEVCASNARPRLRIKRARTS